MDMMKLQNGDAIGVISPCHIAERGHYEAVFSELRKAGFEVKAGKNLYSKTYGYSASPEERAEDFMQMSEDPDVKMILFGGGEGGNEILPYLDFAILRSNPKIMASYSDGTTILNTIYNETGIVTFYGIAPSVFLQWTEFDKKHFYGHFVDGNIDQFIQGSVWKTLHSGCGEGKLIGGYLLNFALLQGSSYFQYDEKEDYILFLEDYKEYSRIEAVSAYFSHIGQSGIMSRVRGVLFGHYSESQDMFLMDILTRLGNKYRIPVVYCDDFGHGERHGILPIGVRARLDADEQRLEFIREKAEISSS